jgi:hypothetical protein
VVAYSIPIINYILSVLGIKGIFSVITESNYLWLWAVVPIFIMIVIIAPYKIWKSIRDELSRITTKKLDVEISPLPESSAGQIWGHLIVHNRTAKSIHACYGKLIDWQPKPCQYPYSAVRFAWSTHGGSQREVKTIGAKSKDYLDIIVVTANGLHIPKVSQDGITTNLQFMLPFGDYEATIQVGSEEDDFPPTNIRLKIKSKDNSHLELITLATV